MSGSDVFLIDTNVFVETLIERDEKYHRDSLRFLRVAREGQLNVAVAGVSLAELVWVLGRTYKLKKPDLVKAVNSVLRLRGLRLIDEYDYKEALELYQKHAVKFIDCLMASITKVKERKWILVSYDKDFDKLGVKRLEPKGVLSRG